MPDPESRPTHTQSNIPPERIQSTGTQERKGPVPVAQVESPGAAEERENLKQENERLRAQLDARPVSKDASQLQRENDLLRDQLAKVPPQGPPRGTVVHFRRGKETVCRPALVKSDGFIDSVRQPDGQPRWHAELVYGEPYTEDQRGHSFTTNRGYDPGCSPDTWHAPDQCALGYKDQTAFPDPPAPEPLNAVIPAQQVARGVRLPPVPQAP